MKKFLKEHKLQVIPFFIGWLILSSFAMYNANATTKDVSNEALNKTHLKSIYLGHVSINHRTADFYYIMDPQGIIIENCISYRATFEHLEALRCYPVGR